MSQRSDREWTLTPGHRHWEESELVSQRSDREWTLTPGHRHWSGVRVSESAQ